MPVFGVAVCCVGVWGVGVAAVRAHNAPGVVVTCCIYGRLSVFVSDVPVHLGNAAAAGKRQASQWRQWGSLGVARVVCGGCVSALSCVL